MSGRRLSTVVGLACVAILAAPAGAASAAPVTDDTKFHAAARDPIPDSYTVVLKPDGTVNTQQASASLARRHAGTVTQVYPSINGFATHMSAAQAKRLSADPSVAYVVQDAIVSGQDVQGNPPWGLDRVDQTHRPLNQQYGTSIDGTGVHVYVIDSGIRATHTAFGGRATLDRDFVGGNNPGGDCHGHGTHVAGTVGARRFGVAQNVRLHGVRVLGCDNSGSWQNIQGGFQWVIDNAVRPAVINASLGGGPNPAIDALVQAAVDGGITVVLAAMNFGANACNYSPARTPAAITVANSTDADALYTGTGPSNFGPCVDLFAPGTGIESTYTSSDTATAFFTGTSMSSPHVAGVAAGLLQRNPTWTPPQVTQAIITSATPNVISNPGTGTPNRLLFAGNDGSGSTRGDFDGDGRDDVVAFTKGSVDPARSEAQVMLSNGVSFGAPTVWHTFFAPGTEIPLVGDFNGDGRDDIVTFTRGSNADVYVALSDGTRFINTSLWHGFWAPNAEIPLVGDVDGDGRDDIITFVRGTTGEVWVALSDGTRFTNLRLWQSSFALGANVPMVADLNGDGRDDIVEFTRNTTALVNAALSNGTTFNAPTRWHSFFTPRIEAPILGDIDGDGDDDLVTYTRNGAGDVFVTLSNGTAFGGPLKWITGATGDFRVPGLADVNGDGRDDLVVVNRQSAPALVVAQSSGTAFQPFATWRQSMGGGYLYVQPGSLW